MADAVAALAAAQAGQDGRRKVGTGCQSTGASQWSSCVAKVAVLVTCSTGCISAGGGLVTISILLFIFTSMLMWSTSGDPAALMSPFTHLCLIWPAAAHTAVYCCQDVLESIVGMREYDVPYHVRFAIDTGG
jgi:hypothetical protein